MSLFMSLFKKLNVEYKDYLTLKSIGYMIASYGKIIYYHYQGVIYITEAGIKSLMWTS